MRNIKQLADNFIVRPNIFLAIYMLDLRLANILLTIYMSDLRLL